MKRACKIVAILPLLALAGCGGWEESQCAHPPKPVAQTLQPASAPAKLALVVVNVHGENFMPASVVYANDAIALATTYVNSGELSVRMDVGLMSSPRTVNLSVFTPFATSCGPDARYACDSYTGVCGVTSNEIPFTVTP